MSADDLVDVDFQETLRRLMKGQTTHLNEQVRLSKSEQRRLALDRNFKQIEKMVAEAELRTQSVGKDLENNLDRQVARFGTALAANRIPPVPPTQGQFFPEQPYRREPLPESTPFNEEIRIDAADGVDPLKRCRVRGMVISAEPVNDGDTIAKIDAYVIIRQGSEGPELFRSNRAEISKSPLWNASYCLDAVVSEPIIFELWTSGLLRDTFLGRFAVNPVDMERVVLPVGRAVLTISQTSVPWRTCSIFLGTIPVEEESNYKVTCIIQETLANGESSKVVRTRLRVSAQGPYTSRFPYVGWSHCKLQMRKRSAWSLAFGK